MRLRLVEVLRCEGAADDEDNDCGADAADDDDDSDDDDDDGGAAMAGMMRGATSSGGSTNPASRARTRAGLSEGGRVRRRGFLVRLRLTDGGEW